VERKSSLSMVLAGIPPCGINREMACKKNMEVILVDLPGHGKSPGLACDSVREYSENLHRMMMEHNLGKCYIAGHSLGGAISMSLTLSHPDAVKGLIIIGSGAKLRVLPEILDGITRDKEKTVCEIVALAFSQKTSPSMKRVDFNETMKCSADVIFRDFNACNRFNIMDLVNKITAPTLIICGTDDALTPPKYSQYLNKEIKGSQLILIEDAGHMVMWEKPEEVNKAIEEFVKFFL